MGSVLLFDLETIPDPTLGEYVPSDEDAPKFPPPPYHQIVSLADITLDENYRVANVNSTATLAHECDMLSSFVYHYEELQPVLCSWNGRRFDGPVLVARCFRHGIPFPSYYRPRGARYRYSLEGHYDVGDQLADQGAGRMWRLGDAARLIGWPGKGEVTGADVATLAAGGSLELVRKYCLEDVAQLGACFLRAELVRGAVSRVEYQDLALQYWNDLWHRAPELQLLLSQVNQNRFVLCKE